MSHIKANKCGTKRIELNVMFGGYSAMTNMGVLGYYPVNAGHSNFKKIKSYDTSTAAEKTDNTTEKTKQKQNILS